MTGDALGRRQQYAQRLGAATEPRPKSLLGDAMIGEMVAVTEKGYDVLTRFPNELLVW
ncbi:MAG TPA: hypothetical protein VGJ60_02185 [Chloroflexota bacterium]